MPSNWKPERNAAALRMRADGATYKEIGERFGICGERVRQIVARERNKVRH